MPVSDGVDRKTGIVNLHQLLPEQGDTMTVTNVGSHYEIRYFTFHEPPLDLSDDEVERIRRGIVTWH